MAAEQAKLQEIARKEQREEMIRMQYLDNDTKKADAAWNQSTKPNGNIYLNNFNRNINLNP